MRNDCPFCNPKEILLENDLAFAIRDRHPVSRGHTLVIPRRHHESLFESTAEEVAALFSMIREVRDLLESDYSPDGYNIGVNIGRAAGQSIMHLHVHVIPRYSGDHRAPKGGVRGVIKGKQNY